jgi:hypothetical protein
MLVLHLKSSGYGAAFGKGQHKLTAKEPIFRMTMATLCANPRRIAN